LSSGNVTNISGPGNDRPAGSLWPSGTLVKYSDNSSTGVTLTISGTSGTWNYATGYGHPTAGDAFDLFDGYLDANGMTDFDGPSTYEFTGMDPDDTYDIAFYSCRCYAGNVRLNKFIISDVEAFTNSSSTGTEITTTTVSNDSTTVNVLSPGSGYVARFTGISVGDDRDMQIEIDNLGHWNETNALRLAARVSHPYAGINLAPYANLTSANLTGAILTAADLEGATLTAAWLEYANLPGADLTNATLNDANLSGSNITEIQFLSASTVIGVDVTGNNMTGFDLTGQNLTGATLTGANLTDANLTSVTSGGIVGSPSALPINWQLTQGYLSGPEANLSGANLANADLASAILTGAVLTGANLHQALLPAAMPSLPVINGAVVKVVDTLAVSGSVQVDTGGILSVTSDTFTTTGINMQGGTVHGIFGLDLDEIGNISGHGRLFGDVDLGTSGTIAGSGAGLELYGDVSGSGTVSDVTLFGNVNIGASPGAITLEDVTMSDSATTTFEITGTDPSQFDRLILLGTVALGGTVQITFDGFAPELSDTFQLLDLTGGTASSWFSNVVAPEGWTLSTDGLLAVPEPSSLLLLLLAVGCLAATRARSCRNYT